MYVPFFRCESFFFTSPVVPIGFLVLCFPFIPPALPLFSFLSLSCSFQFPFVSLSFLSCRLPISSPHFFALPCISPLLPSISRKKTRVFQRFRAEDVKNTEFFQIFGKRRQDTKTSKEPAGDSSLGPLFCDTLQRLRLVERHQITARRVGDGSPPYISDVGRGGC